MNTHQGHSSSLADSTLTLCETRQELIDQHLSSALEDLSTFLGQFSPPIQQSEMVNSQDSFIQLAFEPDDADVSGLEESLLPSLLPPAPRVEPLKLHRLPPAQVSRTKANRSDGRTDPTYALGRLLDMELVSVLVYHRQFTRHRASSVDRLTCYFFLFILQSAALIESHPTLRALLPSVSRQPSLKVRSSFINMDAEDEQGGDESLDDMLLQDDRRFSNALNISLGLSRDSQALGLFSMDQLEDAIKTSRRQSWVGSLSQDLNSYLDLLDDEVELETQIDQPGNGVALVVLSMQKASVEGSTARIDFCSPNLETNIKKLLSAWRNNKHGPIIHAHQISGPTFHPSKSSSRGVAYCTPWSDELTVHKKGSSAFWGTDLEFLLKQTGCSAGKFLTRRDPDLSFLTLPPFLNPFFFVSLPCWASHFYRRLLYHSTCSFSRSRSNHSS